MSVDMEKQNHALHVEEKRPFHVIAKPGGAICNLDCGYCFYLEKEKLYPQTRKWAMPPDILERFIKQKIESDDAPTVHFAWQGGEPTLLGVDFFRRVVSLQKKYAGEKKIENGFQTNGVLLNDEWCAFFRENDFLIGLSVDGPRHVHDRYRVDKGQKPTFDKVMKGLEILKRHGVAFNTLTVVHRDNAAFPVEIYEFLRESGSIYMQFIPIVEPASGGKAPVTEWSVTPEQWGDFLTTVFDVWVMRDVSRVYVQLFDVALGRWLGLPSALCLFAEQCGDALAIEHNGDLYACDHYVSPQYKLGNIAGQSLLSMVNSARQRQFGRDKSETLPETCRQCEVLFACNGECPKNRLGQASGGEEGLNYLCAGYKKFFRHIDPYMRFMAGELAAGRPPANVMAWAAERAGGFAARRAGANDPCPCGSGLKYKKCCMKYKTTSVKGANGGAGVEYGKVN